MIPYRFMVACALALACSAAFADNNSGSVTRKGKSVPLTAIYAEPMNESNGEYGGVAIVFSDNAQATATVRDKRELPRNLSYVFNLSHDYLDSGTFIAADSLKHTLFKLGAHPGVLELIFCDGCDPDVRWIEGDEDRNGSVLNSRKLKLHITRQDHERIDGTVKYADADQGLAFDVAFALDLGKFGWRTEPEKEPNSNDRSAPPPPPPPPRSHK
jgi:hypothetical protein